MGIYWQGPHDDNWYLYADTNGNIRLIHRWRSDYEKGSIRCPHCNIPLFFRNYRGFCSKCGNEFKTGFGRVYQKNPVGKHNKTKGRGWQSLRLWCKEVEIMLKNYLPY